MGWMPLLVPTSRTFSASTITPEGEWLSIQFALAYRRKLILIYDEIVHRVHKIHGVYAEEEKKIAFCS